MILKFVEPVSYNERIDRYVVASKITSWCACNNRGLMCTKLFLDSGQEIFVMETPEVVSARLEAAFGTTSPSVELKRARRDRRARAQVEAGE